MKQYLNNAIILAAKKHDGQKDKAGANYILHPLHVMTEIIKAGYPTHVAVAGVLHDVIEDTDCTFDELDDAGIPMSAQTIISALSKPEGADYKVYMTNILNSRQDVIVVKYYDMLHNSDISRIDNPTEKDYKRNAKYNYWLAKMRMKL